MYLILIHLLDICPDHVDVRSPSPTLRWSM